MCFSTIIIISRNKCLLDNKVINFKWRIIMDGLYIHLKTHTILNVSSILFEFRKHVLDRDK